MVYLTQNNPKPISLLLRRGRLIHGVTTLNNPKPSILLLLRRGNVELEVNDIPILHHVGFSLLSVLPRGFDFRHGFGRGQGLEILKRHDLRFDETAFEIAVNHPGGLRG